MPSKHTDTPSTHFPTRTTCTHQPAEGRVARGGEQVPRRANLRACKRCVTQIISPFSQMIRSFIHTHLHDAAVAQHGDAVGDLDGGPPVRDEDGRAVLLFVGSRCEVGGKQSVRDQTRLFMAPRRRGPSRRSSSRRGMRHAHPEVSDASTRRSASHHQIKATADFPATAHAPQGSSPTS